MKLGAISQALAKNGAAQADPDQELKSTFTFGTRENKKPDLHRVVIFFIVYGF